MSGLEELKQTFFEECDELLTTLESELEVVQNGDQTDDTVNSIFRAVHSIKGGAGAFGFETLVEFSHTFETLLDEMRNGNHSATDTTVEVLFQANDILADLVGMAQEDTEPPTDFGADVRAKLAALVAGTDPEEATADSTGSDSSDDGIDFTPVSVDDTDTDDQSTSDQFTIVFKPSSTTYEKANEPLLLIRELGRLGEIEVVADFDAIPTLDNLNPFDSYLGWTITLDYEGQISDIEEIFEFVAEDCTVEIMGIGSAANTDSGDQGADEEELFMQPVPVGEMEAKTAVSEEPSPTSTTASVGKKSDAPKAETAEKKSKPEQRASVRVDLGKIDRVVNMVGEIVITQAMLAQTVDDLPDGSYADLHQGLEELFHHTRELQESVMSIRAQPVKSVFQRMPRLVREVSGQTGKKARLVISGETTEVDKTIVEKLSDPLTHILRNAVDHGLESPEKRAESGKPEEGTINLSAEHRSGRIVIEVKDDGGGINREVVLRKAVEKGLVAEDANLSDEDIDQLILLPGFSTQEQVSDISGRGVGMDVVKRNIQEIGGRVAIQSVPGKGTSFQLLLPLTLAVMDGMVVTANDQTFVLPLSNIVECLKPNETQIQNLAGVGNVIRLRGEIIQLSNLNTILGLGERGTPKQDAVVVILEAAGGARLGIAVEQLLGQQQIVVKSIEKNYGSVAGLSAATILGDGKVAFIADVEGLLSIAQTHESASGADIENLQLAG